MELKQTLKKILMVVAGAIFLFSCTSFAEPNDPSKKSAQPPLEKYTDWVGSFHNLGIRPTPTEIRAKSKSLGLNSDVLIDAEINGNSGQQVQKAIDSRESNLAFFETLPKMTMRSNSETTRMLGDQLRKVLNEVRNEQNKRDVVGFFTTKKKLDVLSHKLTKRLDAEGTVEQVRDKLPPSSRGLDPRLASEENEIKTLIFTFYSEEKNADFEPMPWVQDFIDNKVNPYIEHMNASLR